MRTPSTKAEAEAIELFVAITGMASLEGRLLVLPWRTIRAPRVERAVDRLGELRRLDCSPPDPEAR